MSQTEQQDTGTWLGGMIAVVLTLVGWSSVPLFLKHFAASIDAWTSNGWRYGFAAMVWAPVLLLGLSRRSLPRRLFRAALVPSVINCAGQVCFTWAHYKIDPGLLTFGLRLQIVFVAVGALILFPNERRVIRSFGFIAGVLLVTGGTLATLLLGKSHAGMPEATTLGIVLSVASGLFFAGYGLSVRQYMHGIRPLVAFAAISQYTAAGMVLLMILLGRRGGLEAIDLGGEQFVLLLLSSFIGIALGHVCYYTSIARLGVAVSSGVIQLQPFLVAVASYFLFREVLTIGQWASGMIAIFGAGVMLWVQHRMRARKSAPRIEDLTIEFAELPPDHIAGAAVASRLDGHAPADEREPAWVSASRPSGRD